MGTNAREFVNQKFNLSQQTTKLENIYQKLL